MWTDLIIERSILHSYPASQLLVSSGHADRLHLIEELRTYCKPGFPLHNCPFSFLFQLACTIYITYGMTEAAAYAQHHNTSAAKGFFGIHAWKVPAPHLGSFPQSSPSHPDLDDGISFTNANDNDNNGDNNNNNDDGNGDNVPFPGVPALLQSQTVSDSTGEDIQPTPPNEFKGDTLLYNNILFYRNILHLYEFNSSVHDGNIGQMFEIIKVILNYSHLPLFTLDYSGFIFIFLELAHQTMVMNFSTKHVIFGGTSHPRLTLQYSPVIWSTHQGTWAHSMNATFSRNTSTSG